MFFCWFGLFVCTRGARIYGAVCLLCLLFPLYKMQLYLCAMCACYDHLIMYDLLVSFTGQCPALAAIPNGAITYDPDMIAPYDVDTVATHSCDPGFRLSGFETRQCLAGGIWSNLVPVCLGTYKIR